jgi:hypothetical protein
MKFILIDLLDIKYKVLLSEAEVVQLSWAYKDEDYDMAVIVPDTVSYEEARQVENV